MRFGDEAPSRVAGFSVLDGSPTLLARQVQSATKSAALFNAAKRAPGSEQAIDAARYFAVRLKRWGVVRF